MAQLSGAATKLDALKWRCIGPSRGGRVVAVAGDPEDRGVFYSAPAPEACGRRLMAGSIGAA
jgi:hypothetical protein